MFFYIHFYEKETKKLIDYAFGTSHLNVQPKKFRHEKPLFWNNNPKLERQQIRMRNDGGVIEFYNCPLFS
jgi:hypothetical protein